MILSERIPIIGKSGVTLYGRVIGLGGKLGRYEVYSDVSGNDGTVYQSFAEAERRFDALEYVQSRKENNNQ